MRVPQQHFQASPCHLTAFVPAMSGSRGYLSSSVPLVLRDSDVNASHRALRLPFVLPVHAVPSGGWLWAEDSGFHHVLMTPALYISLSLDPLRAAKQFMRWVMKMEIWIKAYLPRSGWGNACRRKQLLHFCLAEDAVFVPPSLSGILLSFPHSFFLYFLFCFLHPGHITGFNFLCNRTIRYWWLCYKL